MALVPAGLCTGPRTAYSDPLVRPGGTRLSVMVTTGTAGARRTSLALWTLEGPTAEVLETECGFAPGRGLAGGAHAWRPDGGEVLACDAEGGIVAAALEGDRWGEPRRVRLPGGRRWWGPAYSADGTTAAAVADMGTLVTFDVATGEVLASIEAADGYCLDAAWRRGTATCHTWSRPAMGWTAGRIPGVECPPGVSMQQPGHSRGHTGFGWVDDSTGTANVTLEADGIVGVRTVIDDDCEHAGPTWGPGQRSWCLNDDATMAAYTRNESGFGSLWVYDRRSGERTFVARGVHGCLSWSQGTLVAMRSGARTPDEVVAYEVNGASPPRRVLALGTADARWSGDLAAHLVEPETHETGGIAFRLYRAPGPEGGLLVWVHGGPTDQWRVTWRPRFSYWISRGYSVAVPDHRGSSGHGRAFMLALEGLWGAADADDVAAVTRAAQGLTGCGPGRTALMGASAGGLSVLGAANRHEGLAAGIVTAYPVVDLALLAEAQDPFEGHYNAVLTGDTGLSPHLAGGHLARVPVLAFHGDADTLVVPEHSLRLRDALAARGGSVTVVMMPGEGHGFSDPSSIEREFALTGEFLSSVLRAGPGH